MCILSIYLKHVFAYSGVFENCPIITFRLINAGSLFGTIHSLLVHKNDVFGNRNVSFWYNKFLNHIAIHIRCF